MLRLKVSSRIVSVIAPCVYPYSWPFAFCLGIVGLVLMTLSCWLDLRSDDTSRLISSVSGTSKALLLASGFWIAAGCMVHSYLVQGESGVVGGGSWVKLIAFPVISCLGWTIIADIEAFRKVSLDARVNKQVLAWEIALGSRVDSLGMRLDELGTQIGLFREAIPAKAVKDLSSTLETAIAFSKQFGQAQAKVAEEQAKSVRTWTDALAR